MIDFKEEQNQRVANPREAFRVIQFMSPACYLIKPSTNLAGRVSTTGVKTEKEFLEGFLFCQSPPFSEIPKV